MLTPFGPEYLDDRLRAIKSKRDSDYNYAITIMQSFWSEAQLDTRYECGDQVLWNDLYGNLPASSKRQFVFNRIRSIINMITGYQRQHRKSIIAVPLENADQHTADQFTKILMHLDNKEQIGSTISDAFHGACVAGMTLLQVYLDWRTDPVSGDIKVDTYQYNQFIIDPFFRKTDLSDANFVWIRKALSKQACISLFPDKADEILALDGNDSGSGRDGKFYFMPESYGFSQKNLLYYDEYYYRDYRRQKLIVDTQTGESLEWRFDDNDSLKKFLAANQTLELIEQDIPTVRLAIFIQDKCFYDGPNPLGIDDYPFVPVFAYYNPQLPEFPLRIQSVTRMLRDPQYLYNRRQVLSLDYMESVVNTGWIFKENAIVDVKHLYQTGQGRTIPLKEEASMTDIQQINGPQVPPAFFQMADMLQRELGLISGVNEELMGSAIDDKAGILSMLRQGAGLITLQGLFDGLDHAQRRLGKLMIDIIQANYMPGKIQRILEGDQPAPLFYNKAFGKYHCMVQDGFNTGTQKQMQFAQMVQLRQMEVPIPASELLDAATIQNKDRIIQKIEAQEQQQSQMQQQRAQVEMQELQSRIKLAEARAAADMGLYNERTSRVAENTAMAEERKAAAVRNEEAATLDMIKGMKELQSIDLTQVQQFLNILNMIKQQEAVVERQVQPLPSQGGPEQMVRGQSLQQPEANQAGL